MGMAYIVDWMRIISDATDNAMNSDILANSTMCSIRQGEAPQNGDSI